jgi:hypothetical protein
VKGFEVIRGVYLDSLPFDLERNLVTPTFKLKRPQLLQFYKVSTAYRCFPCLLPMLDWWDWTMEGDITSYLINIMHGVMQMEIDALYGNSKK